MTTDEQIAWLTEKLDQVMAELIQTQEELRLTKGELQSTQEALGAAQVRIAELEQVKTPPPAFVKEKKKKSQTEEKKPRKKREESHNHARKRSAVPTQIVEHRSVECPDCHLRLGGISLARCREVIDVPPPPAVEVTEHRVYKGWCAGCQRWHEAPVDFSEQVLGKPRIGVRLASMIAYLRTVMRLPLRQLQEVLRTLHGFEGSLGELVELLHRMTEYAQPVLEGLKREVRASPAIQADETGWREDGSNGSIWSVSTPTIRSYEYHHSRGGEVVKQLIGDDYQGVLGSDFYAGYNIHQGLHQRCWVHFLRDVHDLKKKFPHDEALLTWANQVKATYEDAVAWAPQGPDPACLLASFVQFAWSNNTPLSSGCGPSVTPMPIPLPLSIPSASESKAFCASRFVLVAIAGVPAHNNLAERSVRPLVIARKISGGTRSPKGSKPRMGLASLLGT